MIQTYSDLDLDTLVRTLYGEARGESDDGVRAVVWVILNRLARPGWWSRHKDDIPDDTIAAVCREPLQFSCWNSNDPNLPKMMALKPTDKIYQRLQQLAFDVLHGKVGDMTKGSTHYHTTGVAPKWSRGLAPAYVAGTHKFFNNVP